MIRTLKTIVIPVLTGLALLALVGLLGSALVLYREASAVHPALGWVVAAMIAAGVVLLIGVPVIQVLRLPGAIRRPRETAGPKWDRFLRTYGRRLLGNQALREDYERLGDLRAALEGSPGEVGKAAGDLEGQVALAVRHLDRKAQTIIGRHAAAVFTATAVSQSGRLDAAIVISAQLRMVREIATLYYQRPGPRELWALYANVGAATFLAGEIQDSEALAVLAAPVSAGLAGLVPVGGADPLISLLVNSLLDGSANAFLTLRVGAVARRYCGVKLEGDRSAVARSASLEAAGLLSGVVGRGASRVAAMTRRLVVESTVHGTVRTVKGAAGRSAELLGKIIGLAGRAGAAAAEGTGRSLRFLTESLRFWETVVEETSPEDRKEEPAVPPVAP